MADFACCIVYDGGAELRFLVQDSISFSDDGSWVSEIQTKFPGGMQKKQGNSLVKTMQREVFEELGLRVRARHKISKSSQTRHHAQHAFLASFREDCRGELRTVPIVDGNSVIFPPYWATVENLERKLLPSHAGHMRAALRALHVRPRS